MWCSDTEGKHAIITQKAKHLIIIAVNRIAEVVDNWMGSAAVVVAGEVEEKQSFGFVYLSV